MNNTNEKEVREQRIINLATDTLSILKQVDMDKKWGQMEHRIDAARHRQRWMRAQRIAAILAIPLLLTVLVQYIIYNKKEKETIWFEARTNPGMTTSITLPDGTLVYLNSESSLKYPAHFNGKKRAVSLSGEGYFEVSKNAKQPFMVSTPQQLQIEVTGTHFNIEAYAQDMKVKTTLTEGSVNVYYPTNNSVKKIKLAPQQKLVYTLPDKEIELLTTSGESEIAWKDNLIIFNSTPLNEALRMLEKRFNVEFIIKNEQLLTDIYSGTFSNQQLEQILQYFTISSQIRWKHVKNPDVKSKRSYIEIY